MEWNIESLKIVVSFLTKRENQLQKPQEKLVNIHIMVQMESKIMFQTIFLMAHLFLLERMEV